MELKTFSDVIFEIFPNIKGPEWQLIFVFTVISTSFGALFQYSSHAFSRRMSLSNILVEFSTRYNRLDMYDAMVLLTDYYKKNPGNLVARWAIDQKNNEPWVNDLKLARRTVDRFYFDVAQLHRGRFIGKRFARALCGQWGLNAFYLICAPMRSADSPKHEGDPFKVLKGLRKAYGDGKIH